mmetsp:Transcript_4953/g.9931  ORF Transcript_4953/g.9931 Transcript_4953/m.9931 type:complete len:233 (+) Transcript_4953:635-1333(+)
MAAAFLLIHFWTMSAAAETGATLSTLPPCISMYWPVLLNPAARRTARQAGKAATLAWILGFSRLTLRNLGSTGSRARLDSRARRTWAEASASLGPPASSTSASSRDSMRSCIRSRAEKEKPAAPATRARRRESSLFLSFWVWVRAGLEGSDPVRSDIMKDLRASSCGNPCQLLTMAPSRMPKTVGRAWISRAEERGRSLSLLSLTRRKAPPALTAISSRMGPRCLQGPHQSA